MPLEESAAENVLSPAIMHDLSPRHSNSHGKHDDDRSMYDSRMSLAIWTYLYLWVWWGPHG